MTSPRWLLLAHQLPTRSSNARVKTWRRLQQIGAVPSRNSVYVLPNTDQCREDFEWIRAEIVALGGEATVFAADALNRDGSEDIVAIFRQTRDTDYRAVKRDADKMLSSARVKRTGSARGRDAWSRGVRSLRARFNQIERIDFFQRGSAPAGRRVSCRSRARRGGWEGESAARCATLVHRHLSKSSMGHTAAARR